MEVGVGLRGVSQDQDTRYSNKDLRLLRTTKFPPEFNQKVDMRKVELEVMKPWIAKTINTLLGFEDEVVIEYVSGLLEDEKDPIIDPKKMQVSLTGFLETKTPEFMTELWRLLLSAQASPLRVPPEFIEQKKLEMRARQEKEEKAIARRQEEAVHDQQIEVIRQRERRERRDGLGEGYQRRPPPRDFGGDSRAYLNGREEDDREPRRQRRRFESPPRDRRPPRRSYSPDAPREAPRGRSRSRSPPALSSTKISSHVSPSPPPARRRRRSSTPPRRRYSPSPEPRRRRRDSRSLSPAPRQRSPPRRRYDSGDEGRRSASPRSRERRRGSTPLQRDRNGTPDEPRRDRWDDQEEEPRRIETLEDKEAQLRAQMMRRKVEATIR